MRLCLLCLGIIHWSASLTVFAGRRRIKRFRLGRNAEQQINYLPPGFQRSRVFMRTRKIVKSESRSVPFYISLASSKQVFDNPRTKIIR